MTFGTYLKDARLDRGMTLEDFSTLSKISKVSLSLYENDKKIPGRYGLLRLAEALKVEYITLREIIKNQGR
jgi:transcriptional regulator with XRE-family HTH domain